MAKKKGQNEEERKSVFDRVKDVAEATIPGAAGTGKVLEKVFGKDEEEAVVIAESRETDAPATTTTRSKSTTASKTKSTGRAKSTQDDRQAKLDERALNLEHRENDLNRREAALERRERELAAREQAVAEKEQTLQSKEASLTQRESEVAAREQSANEPRTYRVESGDTLGKIAQKFYGDAAQWPRIFEANRDIIANPDLIVDGWVIRIPR
ncbi:MAG: LysM peptidoglycan-binding domain-containing protein [Anaerolineales bacterium]|nr:LysM peptidoglycan-binding domain-containing protein [Anaerolineales bacterium]MCB9128218.1 LysM peptidoglycan-binding domain-containing protein [Ardenticatenales bacterium]